VKERHPLPAFLIVCTALLATGTLIVRGNSCGHDFDFHLLSWMEVARAWHSGLLYPHWVQDANYGAGEPRLIFYPPASWLLGALLGGVFGWHAAPVLFVLLALLAAGFAMYRLAREWAPSGSACFAACLYIANPYTMFVIYERSALGELLAAAWLPWMVLYALRPRSSVIPLGLSVAALWLTNSPAAVVGSYMLAILALGMWILERRPWPALRAGGGMALGLGLAAVYIVPAIVQQRWVQIDRAINPGMRVEDSFLFAHTSNAFHDQVLHKASWILVTEIAAASIAAWLAWRRRADGPARIALTTLLPLILFLQWPVSDLLWKYTPHMKFLQFPWRWLLALNIVGCVLAGMALRKPARWMGIVGAAVIAALAIGAGLRFFEPCDEEDAVAPQIIHFDSGQGVEGTDEYTPQGADTSLVQQDLPLVRVLRNAKADEASGHQGENPEWQSGTPDIITASVDAKRLNSEHWLVSVASPKAGYATLRLMDYPAWRVTIDGRPVLQRPVRDDGLMTLPVEAGRHAIEVRWIITPDILAGRAISVIALLSLAGLVTWEHRRRRV
jgi:hypothetical protein